MQHIGYLLLLAALVASAFGLLERWRNKRVLATPFRRTGEIAANPRVADAKGNVSCEGPVRLSAPAFAPCSGRACLYYEVEIIQSWTKFVPTEDGVKEQRGRTTLDTVKSGVVFYVDDGSGPVAVDPREGLDVELEKTFEQEQEIGWGDVFFNGFHAHVPDPGEGMAGESVKVIERIVPVDTQLFVLGQLDETSTISRPKGLTGSLLASRRGRNDLIRRTKRNAMIGTIAAAILMCPGLALAAFGETASAAPAEREACALVDESKDGAPCTGQIHGDYGSDVRFTVTRRGTYQVTGRPASGKAIPLIAMLDVKNADGRVLVSNATGSAKVDLVPGNYVINIRDRVPGAARSFKGGFGYELAVKHVAVAPPQPPPVVEEAPAPPPATTATTAPPVKARRPIKKTKAKR